MSDIFSKQFIFNPTPNPESAFFIPLIVIFALLILAGAAMALLVPEKIKFLFDKYVTPFITFGVLGIIHVFARHEQLYGLASRFFLLLIFLGLFIWIAFILFWMIKKAPVQVKKQQTEERFNKYLPKKVKSEKQS